MREKQVAFTQPYRQTLSGVVVTEKGAAHRFADLKGKKLGVVKGTVHQHYLHDKQKGSTSSSMTMRPVHWPR